MRRHRWPSSIDHGNRTGEASIRSSPKTTILGIVALLGSAVAAAGVIARNLPITDHARLVGAAFSPYLVLAAPLALALILVCLSRHWVAVLVAILVAVGAVVAQTGTANSASGTTMHGVALRVMTANMKLGSANPEVLVGIAEHNADIVALQELTPESARRLDAAGLGASFPYHFDHPIEGGGGAGLWSRYPLVSPTIVRGFQMVFISSRVALIPQRVDGPWVLVAHLAGPWPQPIAGWREDIAALRTVMAKTARAVGPGAVLVAGDFNSTLDMRPFRELLCDGYVDAGQATGARTIPTFPADAMVPPFLGIDHVLLRNATATAVRAVPQPGSDHRALIVDVDIPNHLAHQQN